MVEVDDEGGGGGGEDDGILRSVSAESDKSCLLLELFFAIKGTVGDGEEEEEKEDVEEPSGTNESRKLLKLRAPGRAMLLEQACMRHVA